ncbi:MAG TPA: glycosyl transferase family 1 [Cytophagales bacterium]|nr:glycosyl transferase family 1 [Cytophagales bacterium]
MAQRKKIFLETSKLSNLNSGLGQFCLHLGRAINRNNNDFDLTFLVPESCNSIFGDRNQYVFPSKLKRIFGLSVDVDLWHCFHQGSAYLPKHKSSKLIVTVHDLNFTVKYSGWKLKKELWLLQHQLNRADAIVAISEFTQNEILKHTKVDPKKITVIYNGVNAPEVQAKKPAFITKQKFLFSIGIISTKKNFHVLIPLLKETDSTLIIAGHSTGSYANQILLEAEKLGVKDRLILPGEISEEEKIWLYQNCEAFLFPSLAEGFGLPVIEAMREGKPVFCSDQTSLPEIGGAHAYYFTDFNPLKMKEVLTTGMNDFYSNPEKKKLIQNWAAKFSWEKASVEYLKLYHRLLV